MIYLARVAIALQLAVLTLAFQNLDNGNNFAEDIQLEKRVVKLQNDFSYEENQAMLMRQNYHRANTKPIAANMWATVSDYKQQCVLFLVDVFKSVERLSFKHMKV